MKTKTASPVTITAALTVLPVVDLGCDLPAPYRDN